MGMDVLNRWNRTDWELVSKAISNLDETGETEMTKDFLSDRFARISGQ